MKPGSFILLVTSSCLTLAGGAHAQGGRSAEKFWAAPAPSSVTAVQAVHVRANGAQLVLASWYGGGERLGRRTSTGETFRAMGHTAAHRTLPFGTLLRVSALATGRSTIVRINDRGPAASTGRALDLSRGAAMDLGIAGAGSARVMMEVMR
ncbi:MAG: septal ring lytic transglycosylase RlpA family protein [Roseiarcus sp.]|jgi:peptidoglycan lytic transglycosylase